MSSPTRPARSAVAAPASLVLLPPLMQKLIMQERRRMKISSSTKEIGLSSKGVVDRKWNWKLGEIPTVRIVEGIWSRREVWRRREMTMWWNLRGARL